MPGFGGGEGLVDAMERGAFPGLELPGGDSFGPVNESNAAMDSPDFPVARVDGIGNRTPLHGNKGNADAGGGAAGGGAQDFSRVIDERFTGLQTTFNQQLQQQSQTFLHALNEIVGRLSPSQAAAVAEAAEPENPFTSIEDMLPADEWAALPVETKQALRVIEANNRRNFEAILSKLPTGQSPELKAALDKVNALEKQFTDSQSAQRFNTIAQQAQAAKAKFDPDGTGTLAPYQHKIAEAIEKYGCDVDTAIRIAAPQVYNAAVVREAMKTETKRIQNETVAALYGLSGVGGPGAPNGDAVPDLSFKVGETVQESRSKILAKLGLGGNGRLY